MAFVKKLTYSSIIEWDYSPTNSYPNVSTNPNDIFTLPAAENTDENDKSL